MSYIILGILLLLSACFSGLTLGMMSLGPHDLKRKVSMGDKKAKKIYPIRKKGNLLLVTLLIGNVAVNSVIAIYMGSIASGLVAGIISTLLITIFGEIFPQAVFSRFALDIGSKFVWLVKIFLFIFYPIAAPLAFILNKTLGEEMPTMYSRGELKEIILEHSTNNESEIDQDEANIARGAFTFGEKTVKEVMVPKSSVIGLNKEDILDQNKLLVIAKYGYPRIPVIDKDSYEAVGVIYTYDLLDPKNSNKKAADICDKNIFYVGEDSKLDLVLNMLIKKKLHMLFVVNEFDEYSGIITVEDIIEDILGQEIFDEYDVETKAQQNKKQVLKKIA